MELHALPFDAETVFAKVKKKRLKKLVKLRGPDSPLYRAIWPMIYTVRVFGFAPYNFSQDRLVPSNINLIFTAIATIFYSYLFYQVFNRFLSIKRGNETLDGTENTKVSEKLIKIKQKTSRDIYILSKINKSRIYLFI